MFRNRGLEATTYMENLFEWFDVDLVYHAKTLRQQSVELLVRSLLSATI